MNPLRSSTAPRRAAVLAAALLVLSAALPAPMAHAETGEEAAAAAKAAAAHVDALQPQVDRATRRYEEALRSLAQSVTRSVTADESADAAAKVARDSERRLAGRVRALYMSGGSAALYASVLEADNAPDAMRQVAYVSRLVAGGRTEANVGSRAAANTRATARTLAANADALVVTASDVAERQKELTAVLAQAQSGLARLSARAKTVAAAEAAAARLRALAAAAAQAAAALVARAEARTAPADYKALYVAAARTCDGLSWTILSAIGQVETGHGRNTATSSAGAQGPMQFMPVTFARYGVDGDGDGDADIRDPADAIFSAANYLCANGAGRGDAALRSAIWHYNHADWYVELVLTIAAQLESSDAS